MTKWNYTIHKGKFLREAICAKDAEQVVKCLIACYKELLQKLSDEDKEWQQFDIEDSIAVLENYEIDEDDVDDYLVEFYDLCDELRAWISI